MTIIAGIYSQSDGVGIPERLSSQLQSNVSRNASDQVISFVHRRAHLFKVDIGAFNSRGHAITEADGALMIAGEPLIGSDPQGHERSVDVDRLFGELLDHRQQALRSTTGTFCGAFFDARSDSVQIFCDKSGVRPLFFVQMDGLVVFASALRILEAIPDIAKELDVQGLAETACFGFPLADRTAYRNVKAVGAGELICFDRSGRVATRYWDWAAIANEGCGAAGFSAKEGWTIFVDAISRRLRGDRASLAFLSGGLDSRAIVGALTELGTQVASINFAPPATQDQAFARDFARSISAHHSEFPVTANVVNDPHRTELVRGWIDGLRAEPFFARIGRRILWSGDGGSVGMGHVYLTPEMIELARTRGDEAAADEFLIQNNCRLTPRIFRSECAASIVGMPKRGMLDELASFRTHDRGKALYLFLMLNDQRRHLQKHFEEIDLQRLEFNLPFFDGALLEFVMRAPIDTFLGHGFYMDWIAESRVPLTLTPWQAYRGHVPCPLPISAELGYQWGRNPFDRMTIRRMQVATVRKGIQMLLQRRFPDRELSRANLSLVVLALLMGKAELQYLIKMADAFCRPARYAGRP